MKLKLAKSCENAAKSQILRRLVDSKGFDLPCGAGRLGLKRAPGTFPRALGFESLGTFIHKYKGPPYGRPLVFVAEMEGFEPPDGVARQLISSRCRYPDFERRQEIMSEIAGA